MECAFIDMHHWSLKDIDETDIESMIPIFFYYPRWKARGTTGREVTRKAYADEAEL
jgi:hypothetical protein